MGVSVVPYASQIPVFEPSSNGSSLCAIDELGRPLDDVHTLCAAAFCAMRRGETVYALPNDAAILESMADALGAKLIRLTASSPQTLRIAYAKQRFMFDAVYRAAFLCAFLDNNQFKLASLYDRLPSFRRISRELPLRSDRAQMMRSLAAQSACSDCSDGMRLHTNDGWVYITPSSLSQALRITVDAFSSESAAELADSFETLAKKLDAKTPPQKICDSFPTF